MDKMNSAKHFKSDLSNGIQWVILDKLWITETTKTDLNEIHVLTMVLSNTNILKFYFSNEFKKKFGIKL